LIESQIKSIFYLPANETLGTIRLMLNSSTQYMYFEGTGKKFKKCTVPFGKL
jgi:hypothetical protein